MNRNVVVPVVLTFLSALLTLIFHPVAMLVAGVAIYVIAVLKCRTRKVTETKLGVTLLFRSGLAVISGAIVAVAFVFTTMSGLLGK